MADLFSLAKPLEEPDRSAFIKAATEAVEKLAADASWPGVVHRVLAPLWRQFFHPPSENQSRAYYNNGDDHDARAGSNSRARRSGGPMRAGRTGAGQSPGYVNRVTGAGRGPCARFPARR